MIWYFLNRFCPDLVCSVKTATEKSYKIEKLIIINKQKVSNAIEFSFVFT